MRWMLFCKFFSDTRSWANVFSGYVTGQSLSRDQNKAGSLVEGDVERRS